MALKEEALAADVTYRLHRVVIAIGRYVTQSGKDVIGEWLSGLKDVQARARIAIRIDRLSLGNFGDCKPVREGISELDRLRAGVSRLLCFAGQSCVLLLCGGDKRRQTTDIAQAIEYLGDYKDRTIQR